MSELTIEIIEDDELFRKWLWGEFYDAFRPLIDEINKETEQLEREFLYGTGEEKPVGILRM